MPARETIVPKQIVSRGLLGQHGLNPLKKRPLPVTIISWLFIAVGCIALGYHLQPAQIAELNSQSAFGHELIWVALVRALAIVAGTFMLRGCNWARWLLVIWIGYHVILSGWHSLFQLIVHGLLFIALTWLLFRRPVSAFFHANSPAPAPAPGASEEPTK